MLISKAFRDLLAPALLAFLAVLPGPSGALGEPTVLSVDCATTEFAFADPAYKLACQRVEDDVALARADGGGKGDIRNEILVATSAKDRVYISAVSMRLLAARFGFTRADLKQVIDEGFRRLVKTDWRPKERRGDYEVAEFRANDRECAAWQRYANPTSGVYKRHVFGFGCSPAGVGEVYRALEKLTAPGG
jgi:hypothetical protein